MREIKFRGKQLGSGEWVYGHFIKTKNHKDNCYISQGDPYNDMGMMQGFVNVDPETVGQSTGLKDNNGKEIYEGDIVEFTAYTAFREQSENRTEVVTYSCEPNGRVGFTPMVWQTDVEDDYYNYEIENIRIIGNIYENPELLEDK